MELICIYLKLYKKIKRTGEKVDVILPNSTINDVDIVILSIGVRPDSSLAKNQILN